MELIFLKCLISTDSSVIVENNFDRFFTGPSDDTDLCYRIYGKGYVFGGSKAIIKLSKNKILREKYGKNSRKLVEGDMALEHICYQYHSLYEEMI